jgi:hypothetical protein
MSYYPGERVYDPRTGHYLGRYKQPIGSAYSVVVKDHKTEKVKNEKIS